MYLIEQKSDRTYHTDSITSRILLELLTVKSVCVLPKLLKYKADSICRSFEIQHIQEGFFFFGNKHVIWADHLLRKAKIQVVFHPRKHIGCLLHGMPSHIGCGHAANRTEHLVKQSVILQGVFKRDVGVLGVLAQEYTRRDRLCQG